MIVKNTSHYTPPELAREIVNGAIDPLLSAGLYPSQIRVLDPACGDGVLLQAALEKLVTYTESYGFGEVDHHGRWSPGEK